MIAVAGDEAEDRGAEPPTFVVDRASVTPIAKPVQHRATQQYVPIDGWQAGTYTFQLVIVAVSDGTETVLATIDVTGEIVVP